MRFLAAPALALIAATSASAQGWLTDSATQPIAARPPPMVIRKPIAPEFINLRLLLPAEYDHEYDKPLELTFVQTQDEVRAACSNAVFTWYAMGCNKRWSYQCKIFMLAPDVLRDMGMPPEAVYRHELGHCNGWSLDGKHWGSRAMHEVGIHYVTTEAGARSLNSLTLKRLILLTKAMLPQSC